MRTLISALSFTVLTSAALYGQAGVLTWHNDNARTGQYLQETILTHANVNASTFGKLFVLGVDGKVDAQPLYAPALTIPSQGVHNVVYVVTEHDSVYAFDAGNGQPLKQVSMLLAGEVPSDNRGCGQVTPEIGITGTPAIDLQMGPHGTMYLVSMSKDGAGHYHQRLHALDLTTLGEQFGGPVEIQATYPGTGVENVFDPKQHKERPGLLIANGLVYTSWSSHCDFSPYTGWVISYNESTLAQVNVLNLTPNGNDGAIWAAGSGPAADQNGSVYLLTGNGTFDSTLNGSGFPVNGDYGNAFVKMSNTGGTFGVADYFTMSNTVSESNADTDLGSGGIMLLPALNDAQGQPRALAVGAGKDHNIYIVDRTNMGKFNPSMDAIYQLMTNAMPSGVFSSPAWFNGKLYYGGVSDTLKAFAFTSGTFAATPASHSANSFPYPGTTPSISANGTSNGIAWAAENAGTAVLHAYDAGNLATELYNSNQAANGRDHFGAGNKFIVPTVANGKVYVGTTNGVGVFGLFAGTAPMLKVSKTHAGNFTQGQQNAAYTVVVSNAVGASATTGTVTLTETAPSGLTLVSMAGTGWSCSNNSCTRSDALAGGASFPSLVVTVNVAANAPSQVVNQVSVSGGGSASASTTDPTVTNASNAAPPVFDINSDGKEDLAVYFSGSGGFVYSLLSIGNGTYNAIPASGINPGGVQFDTFLEADLNGDGASDLVLYDSVTGTLKAGIGNRMGAFNYASTITIASGFTAVQRGDFNGDGKTDLLFYRKPDGLTTIALSNGDGTFTLTSNSFSAGFTNAILGDFNGDGKSDVVFYNGQDAPYNGYLGIGDGAGNFTFSSLFLGPGFQLFPADLDGDGKTDFIMYRPGDGTAYFAFSTGTGFNYTYQLYSPGFTAIKIGNINSDGFPDLVLYNANSGMGYLGIGNGTASFSFSSLFFGPGMDFVDLRDVNGDGKKDVVLYRSPDGTNYTGISTGAGFNYTYNYFGPGRVVAR